MSRSIGKIGKKAIWQKGALAILFILLLSALSACGGKTATKYQLKIFKIGDGIGVVKSLPSGDSCGANCQEYNSGAVVELTAKAGLASQGAVYRFAGWSGDCSGSNISCTLTMDAAKEVTAKFTKSMSNELVPDKNLQNLIRKTLALPEEHKITVSDLKKLKTLKCNNCTDLTEAQKIVSLIGLEHATDLEDLELQYNKISDITPLANLIKLSKLYLYHNDISDISALSGLTNLNSLWIIQNRITDVSPLAKLINLQDLDIAYNKISDISSLAKLKELRDLNLYDNKISDISALAALSKLQRLYIGDNIISDISALAALSELKIAYLHANKISDISSLAGLTKLEELGLSYNLLNNNISAIKTLKKLRKLKLDGNYITNIKILEDNAGLGAGDNIALANNCLDISAGERDMLVIQKLQSRGATVSYKPQRTTGCP